MQGINIKYFQIEFFSCGMCSGMCSSIAFFFSWKMFAPFSATETTIPTTQSIRHYGYAGKTRRSFIIIVISWTRGKLQERIGESILTTSVVSCDPDIAWGQELYHQRNAFYCKLCALSTLGYLKQALTISEIQTNVNTQNKSSLLFIH